MSLLGHIAAGALQGVGQGITNVAIEKRNAALEYMRQKAQAERDARMAEARANERKEDREWQEKRDDKNYQRDLGKLAFGAKAQAERDKAQHGYKMSEIKTTQLGQQEQAKLESRLASARTKEEIALRDKLGSGEIKYTVRGDDGMIYGITRDGNKVETGIRGSPTAAEVGQTGGGRLTEGEQESAYLEEKRKWREGGQKGPEPRKADFIGMTREDYDSRRRGGPKPAASAPASKPKPQKRPVLTQAEYSNAVIEGQKKFPGLSAAQLRKKLEDIYAAAGYDLPAVK